MRPSSSCAVRRRAPWPRAFLVLGVLLAVTGCGAEGRRSPRAGADSLAGRPLPEAALVVERLGERLRQVSLLAPERAVAAAMREHYADLVTPELLGRWIAAPRRAPGRLVSSPWPERIEVRSVTALGPDRYRVTGEIVENTSAGARGRRSARFVVVRTAGGWRIADYDPAAGDTAGGP